MHCLSFWGVLFPLIAAYKHADGKKIDGRRVLVDVERGRTVKGWLPRRLGGGLGGTRRGGPEVNVKHSGREEARPEDRYMNRERGGERAERPERRRSRSRSRERRPSRRSRSRSRERHRGGGERHKRERSRDKDRTREHEVGAGAEKEEGVAEVGPEAPPEVEPRKRRQRSRSRDRDRKQRSSRRSRSRDRKRRDYDRGDREGRRERERPRDQDDRALKDEPETPDVKQENFDNNGGYEGDYNNYNNNSMESAPYEGY